MSDGSQISRIDHAGLNVNEVQEVSDSEQPSRGFAGAASSSADGLPQSSFVHEASAAQGSDVQAGGEMAAKARQHGDESTAHFLEHRQCIAERASRARFRITACHGKKRAAAETSCCWGGKDVQER